MVLSGGKGVKMEKNNNNAAQATKDVAGTPCEANETLARLIAGDVVRAIEARWGDAFAKLSSLPKIKTAAESARRDTGMIIRRLDGSYGETPQYIETCTLKGAKRGQFLRLCELKKANPGHSLCRCARLAVNDVTGEDGYGLAGVSSLVEYAKTHRSWWRRDEEPDASAQEGGAE